MDFSVLVTTCVMSSPGPQIVDVIISSTEKVITWQRVLHVDDVILLICTEITDNIFYLTKGGDVSANTGAG